MRKGGGNHKGGAYERKINKTLSLWLSEGSHEDWLVRTGMSGGRATVYKKKGIILENIAGDAGASSVEAVPFIRTFFLEYKCYNSLNILLYVFKESGVLHRFWDTASQEAADYNRTPLMIFKQNRSPDMIMFRQTDFYLFRQRKAYKGFKISIDNKVCILELSEFLKSYVFEGVAV